MRVRGWECVGESEWAREAGGGGGGAESQGKNVQTRVSECEGVSERVCTVYLKTRGTRRRLTLTTPYEG